ncbi:uncharacterized protein Tco_0680995 [Tanacetum coccineum]|uniref:HAT C-terminal dimerisation domain-containing protein n=1 Tax=Tanacetum coccineum TaxID=301880 RepID=A0ABQ4XMX0_9ASTR
MRRFINQSNLHRPAVTRFATSFITLAQLHIQQNNLKKMTTLDDWNNIKWSKEVLRMADGDKKLAMGYIYEVMDRLKEVIVMFYDEEKKETCEKVTTGLYACIRRLTPNIAIQYLISKELDLQQNTIKLFGDPMTIRRMKTKSPDWWISYGSSTLNLQKFVIRVLSLTCSATGCERN